MTARLTTKAATESDIEARIDAALRRAFPWLQPVSLRHQLTFSFDIGHETREVDGATVSLGKGRLDILVLNEDVPLAILELKRPGLSLTEEDRNQGLSYARMMHPRPPLVVVTNGDDMEIVETHSGEPWQPESPDETAIQKSMVAAARVAEADLKQAIATLLGPNSSIWVGAIRSATEIALADITGAWTDPYAIFVTDFHIPRTATSQAIEALRGLRRVVLVEGAPLVGKSHVLREVAKQAAEQEDLVVLFVDVDGGGAKGILLSIADLLATALGWPVSVDEVRHWLQLMSNTDGPTLVIALDGLSLQHQDVQREVFQLSSAPFGDQLKLLIEADHSLADQLWFGSNGRKPTAIARRGERIEVSKLSDSEFRDATRAMFAHGMQFMNGAQHAEEYRQPWVLRAIGDDIVEAPERRQGMTARLPPLLSVDLISHAREKFQDPHLKGLASDFAAALLDDIAQGKRSPEMVLRSMHIFLVRRSNFNRRVSHARSKEMLEKGLIRVILGKRGEAMVAARSPELIASELSLLLAAELDEKLNENAEDAAEWLAGVTSNLPLGDLIGAFTLFDVLSMRVGLPLEFITAMLRDAPKIGRMKPGTVMMAWFPTVGQIHLAVGEQGQVTISQPGRPHEVEVDGSEFGVTYSGLQSWQILAHIGGFPIEVPMARANSSRPRLDPAILATVGACQVPLRRPGEDPEKTALLLHSSRDGGEILCEDSGIVEPITFSLLRFLQSEGALADDWLEECCREGERPLLARLALALRFLSENADAGLARWARTWRQDHVIPALHQAAESEAATEPAGD